jgi:hypothetical protein
LIIKLYILLFKWIIKLLKKKIKKENNTPNISPKNSLFRFLIIIKSCILLLFILVSIDTTHYNKYFCKKSNISLLIFLTNLTLKISIHFMLIIMILINFFILLLLMILLLLLLFYNNSRLIRIIFWKIFWWIVCY